MSNNLNQNLYTRFGLNHSIKIVQEGFKKYVKNTILDKLSPIIYPGSYEQKKELWPIQANVIAEMCRQLYLDESDYNSSEYASRWFFEKEFYDKFEGNFNEYLFRLQVLLNVLYKYKLIHFEISELVDKMDKYFSDFPMLGVMIKTYKRKAPQILPITSKKFEEEIRTTLELLDNDKKYNHVLDHFENGLKEFLIAKSIANYKDVIEDMYTACDELAKVVLNNNNKGFKHIFDKTDAKALGLNSHQKELFKNLRNWVDEIKHGTLKDFDRVDVEMIISMTGSLIRFVILKQSL